MRSSISWEPRCSFLCMFSVLNWGLTVSVVYLLHLYYFWGLFPVIPSHSFLYTFPTGVIKSFHSFLLFIFCAQSCVQSETFRLMILYLQSVVQPSCSSGSSAGNRSLSFSPILCLPRSTLCTPLLSWEMSLSVTLQSQASMCARWDTASSSGVAVGMRQWVSGVLHSGESWASRAMWHTQRVYLLSVDICWCTNHMEAF